MMIFPVMGPLQRHRASLLLFLALVAVASYSIFITYFAPPYPFSVPRSYLADPVPTRRDLARKILKIQRQIEYRAGFDNQVDAAWSEGLIAVIAELDPRVTSARQEKLIEVTQSSEQELPNVCPEVYKGREYDDTHEHNFLEVECSAKKFSEVITVLVIAKGWDLKRIEFVTHNIRKHYNIDIVVVTFGDLEKSLNAADFIVKVFDSDTSEASAINRIIAQITTPYTLVVNSLTHFNGQSPLERLVRVLDALEEVAVAAGAYRDINGYWNHGCLQTTAENYELKYTRGYEHSYHECMYCDDVLGPFVAKSDLLKRVPMTEDIGDGPALYRDWFLNVRLTGNLVMSCPDVMFFVDYEPSLGDMEWNRLSKKWSFQYVHSFDGKNLEISCEDAKISCTNLMKTVSSFLIPPCCREKIRRELEFVKECAQELGLYYELQAGTLLGAVKMDGILPWDFDTDVITDCVDESIWFSKGYECLERKGCSSQLQFGHYWISRCKYSNIDVSCRYNRSATLPAEYRQIATQAELDGKLITVTSNPGRTVRNRYGPEYLKHVIHWRYYNNDNSTHPKDQVPKVTGLWSNCAEPAFHSCLDHFPVDGNIRFKSSTSLCKSP